MNQQNPMSAVERLADAWNATPDYTPSPYDQGRVDQRHEMTTQLLEAIETDRRAELPWIDHHAEVVRVHIYRSSIYGTEYAANAPEFEADEEVGHRDITTTRGTLLGAFPELGTLRSTGDGPIQTLVERTDLGEIVRAR